MTDEPRNPSDYPYDEPTPQQTPEPAVPATSEDHAPDEGQPEWRSQPELLSSDTYGLGQSSTKLAPHVAGALSYVLAVVTGVIFFFAERDNKFVKFHALQSMFLSIAAFVLSLATYIFQFVGLGFLQFVVGIAILVAFVACFVQALTGKWFKIPIIGDLAAKQLGL